MTFMRYSDERILNERRKHRDLPFDVQPVLSSRLEALSRVLFEQEYLPHAFAPNVLAANDRTYEQWLAACKMIGSSGKCVSFSSGRPVLPSPPALES